MSDNKSELLHDLMLDTCIMRLQSGEADHKDLEVIRKILLDQGVTCVGSKSERVAKVSNILSELPVKVAVDNTRS